MMGETSMIGGDAVVVRGGGGVGGCSIFVVFLSQKNLENAGKN